MAVHIHSAKKDLDDSIETNTKIQYMPFKIAKDSEAEVAKYFDSCVSVDEHLYLHASFRGYPLTGQNIKLPEGYKGLILHENLRPSNDKEDRKVYVQHKFSSLVYWNWDKTPNKNDAFIKAINDWVDIAEALHSPIVEE